MRAHSMKNINQILHGDQTDEKKFFYEVDSDKIFVTRILRRDLFAVANLLVCDFAMWLRPNFFMIMGSKKKGDSIYMCNGYCNMTKNCSCIHEIMLYFTQIYSLAHSIKFSPIRSLRRNSSVCSLLPCNQAR